MKATVPSLSWLADPEVFAFNRKTAHSDHPYYETLEEAQVQGAMPLRQSLNGTWLFSYAGNPGLRVKDFYKTDFDCSGFDEIQVPGHIQLQGYDEMMYINTQYPWDGTEFLLDDNLEKGENKLAVEIHKRSSASWIEDQDFWRFSGIFREVYLYAVPKTYYTWVRILGCQMGIGGDDSWGAPVQRRYWLESNVDRTVAFTIRKA